MANKLNKFLVWCIPFLIFSCASREQLVYFQGDEQERLNSIYEQSIPKIQTNDILAISVTAADVRATEPFNQSSVYQTRSSSDGVFRSTYTVDEDGMIDFPVLGQIKLGGLTRTQAINKMRAELSRYIKDPGVNLTFTNFRVSVMGEVQKPGTFTLPNERVSILEALSMAGDLTIQGVRENVMVIREQNGVKETHRINLTSREALDSPVFYLAQNDVVYVEPNRSKIQSSVVNYSIFVSIAGIIISVISVLSR
ncbi:polysaccharide biosynthesis/export family protein [Vaginella massiliensis]|uniref:polysaccharide biosynthesis/export family protein n=1 Tax=Vaginella massiliensis TaxID=1816680 RepID=UPI0037518CB5